MTTTTIKRKTNRKYQQFYNLLRALVQRDLKSRYRRSALGPIWALIQPLVLMLMFSILRMFVNLPSDGIPYPIFTYSALVPWQFFSSGVARSAPSIINNASIIKKIAVPREVFLLAEVIVALFDMAMSGIILAGMMIYYKMPFSLAMLWLPVLIALFGLLAFAVGLFFSSLGTFRSDFLMAMPFLMQIWLYATPIIYPLSSVPERWRTLYMLNPTVGIIEGFRSVLLRAQAPDLGMLGISALVILVGLAIVWPLFRVMSQYFTDVL